MCSILVCCVLSSSATSPPNHPHSSSTYPTWTLQLPGICRCTCSTSTCRVCPTTPPPPPPQCPGQPTSARGSRLCQPQPSHHAASSLRESQSQRLRSHGASSLLTSVSTAGTQPGPEEYSGVPTLTATLIFYYNYWFIIMHFYFSAAAVIRTASC